MITKISMPTRMVREIARSADAAIEAARMSFVSNRPLNSEEWRQIMEILTYTKVSCANALREEEERDALVEPCCQQFDKCQKVCMPRAAAAEREACAKVCDGWLHADGDRCAEAIRARSKE
jgi:hypothetical protein